MNDNSPNKLTIIIVGVLALLMIAILPIAPALFRSTAPTLTFSPLRVDDPLTQLSGDSIEQLFERDTIADLTLTLDTPISELNDHTLREVFEDGNLCVNEDTDLNDIIDGWTKGSTIEDYDYTDGVQTFLVTGTIASLPNSIYGYLGISGDNHYINIEVKRNNSVGTNNFQFRSPNARVIINEILNEQFTKYSINYTIETDRQHRIGSIDIGLSISFKNLHIINRDILGIQSLSVEQMDDYYSLYQKLINLDVDLTAQYSNGIYSNNEEIIYVTPLITAGQYSPLFDSTFDVMSDADIKDQLDDWLVRGFNYPQLTYELTEAQLLYFATLNQEFIDRDGGLPNTITYEIFTSGDLIFDLVPLKTNHQYSPLYMKTFDVMTDAEIIAQMNAWHYENLLP